MRGVGALLIKKFLLLASKRRVAVVFILCWFDKQRTTV
jgi:hypothetical protein